MFKKAIPLVLMSGLVLTACANNSTVPKNNETPMEKVEDRTRDLTPDVKNGQTGPDMDGLENENSTGVDNGVMNEGNVTTPNEEVINEGNTTTPNEVIIDKDLDQNKTNGNNR